MDLNPALDVVTEEALPWREPSRLKRWVWEDPPDSTYTAKKPRKELRSLAIVTLGGCLRCFQFFNCLVPGRVACGTARTNWAGRCCQCNCIL